MSDYEYESSTDTILFTGEHESLGCSETVKREFAAWATGLLSWGDMGNDSPFTILASMDLANCMAPGCGAYGSEDCECL